MSLLQIKFELMFEGLFTHICVFKKILYKLLLCIVVTHTPYLRTYFFIFFTQTRRFHLIEFRRLVANISDVSSYLSKTELVKNFFLKGSDKTKFQGDLHVWIRLLLPGVIKRIYNLQSKQLGKFSLNIMQKFKSKTGTQFM